MIRVFVSEEPEVMSIVELQGKLNVPEEVVPSTARPEADKEDEPVSIGFIETDEHFPSRRTLRIGTLCVEGAASVYRKPVLVLREMPPRTERPAEGHRLPSGSECLPDSNVEEAYDRLVAAEPETEMFSDWIGRHPEMLKLETHYGLGAVPPGSAVQPEPGKKRERDESEGLRVKDYTVIGIVEEHLIFNSKPSRVFR